MDCDERGGPSKKAANRSSKGLKNKKSMERKREREKERERETGDRRQGKFFKGKNLKWRERYILICILI